MGVGVYKVLTRLNMCSTNIGNVRMEAKPCVPPRSELDADRRIASTLTGAIGQMSLSAAPPPPAVSAWGSGPPTAIKHVGIGGPSGLSGSLLSGGNSWEPLPGSRGASSGRGMSDLGDMLDPMGGGFGSMDQMSSAGDLLDPMSSGHGFAGADSSGASSSMWDIGGGSYGSSIDYGAGAYSSVSSEIMKPFEGA